MSVVSGKKHFYVGIICVLIFVILCNNAYAAQYEYYYQQLNDKQKEIYTILYDAYKDDLNLSNNTDKSKIAYDATNGVYVIDLPIKKDYTGMSMDFISADISEVYKANVYPAYIALINDHPELCWISYTTINSVYRDGFWSSVYDAVNRRYNYTLNFISVYINDIGYSQGNANSINRSINGLKSQINSFLPSSASRTEKIKAIHDKICNIVSYENSDPPYNHGYQTIYSLFNDLDGDGKIETVCAGYSKLFKAMCDLYDIPCVVVNGTSVNQVSTGLHMWNFVQLENNRWYAIDTTWNDTTNGIKYYYYLVGSQTLPPSNKLQIVFEESHISGELDYRSPLNFTYPELDKEAYDPNKNYDDLPFTDVKKTSWKYEGIKYMYDHSIMTGKSATIFDPDNQLTRYQMALILYRMSGSPKTSWTVKSFPDVPTTKSYYDAVMWCREKGIITGYDNGSFGPSDKIRRQDMVLMLQRYAEFRKLSIGKATDNYKKCSDYNSVSGYALNAVKWSYDTGMLGSSGVLNPKGNTTRAEAAKMLMVFMRDIIRV